MGPDSNSDRRPAAGYWLPAGVLLIFGGELACLLGANHTACHAAFYAGVAAVVIGAALHYRGRRYES